MMMYVDLADLLLLLVAVLVAKLVASPVFNLFEKINEATALVLQPKCSV